jgi:hypothetical protein
VAFVVAAAVVVVVAAVMTLVANLVQMFIKNLHQDDMFYKPEHSRERLSINWME